MSFSKYPFDKEFQINILRYILTDREGYKLLSLIDPKYFTDAIHTIIALTIKEFHKEKSRIPGKAALKEYTKSILRKPEIANLIDEDDVNSIFKEIPYLYNSEVSDSDYIVEKARNFSRYQELNSVISKFDITNFEGYPNFSKAIENAISIGSELDTKGETSTLLYKQAKSRLVSRSIKRDIDQFPLWQLSKLLNSGGYPRNSLITLIGRQKAYKTGTLINIARIYTRRRRKVLYVDLENGVEALSQRFEQSVSNLDRYEVNDKRNRKKIVKLMNKHLRFGGEIAIERMYNGTTASDIQKKIDDYAKEGLKFDVLIVDYIGVMGSNSGRTDDKDRISDAYLDIKNLVARNDFELCFSAHHVRREALSRESTKFLPQDTAKCIDINRHVDAMLGLQASPQEQEEGVLRIEVIEQRDGIEGSVLLWADMERQRVKEFTKDQREQYNAQIRSNTSGEGTSQNERERQRIRRSNNAFVNRVERSSQSPNDL